MSPLLGHILAQVVSLGMGDRTEGRYIVAESGKYYEAATYVRASVTLGWKHSEVNVGYAPSFTVTPLDSNRQLLVYHLAGIAVTHRWQHTAVTVSESFGIGRLNFVSQGLADPRAQGPATNSPGATPGTGNPTSGPVTPPATGTPTTGTGTPTTPNQGANQIRAQNEVVQYVNSVTAVNVTQKVTPVFTLAGSIGYQVSGSYGSEASRSYPIIRGPFAQGSADYLFTRQDSAGSLLSVRSGVVENSNASLVITGWESWKHSFAQNTNSLLGTGISATRTAEPSGLTSWTIYPTFTSAFNHAINIDRSLLSLTATAASSPTIDPVRATVDPRISMGAAVGWSVEDFYSSLVGGTSLSLAGDSDGALSSAAGAFLVGYRLTPAVAVDSGLRAFWQDYNGIAAVPLTWAAFVGFTIAAATTPR